MSNLSGGTVRYHRAEYVPDIDPRAPWKVWFPHDEGPRWFTASQGEAMGLTPPAPAPLVVTCNGHSIELSDEEARAFVQEWDLHGDREDFFMLSNHDLACDALAGLLRDARQDPQPASASLRDADGSGAFFDQAHPDFETQTWDARPEQDDTPGIDFDALPIGTVLCDRDPTQVVKTPDGWYCAGEPVEYDLATFAPYTVVYRPAPLSPGECLRGLLAGRDDADELIEYAAEAYTPAQLAGPGRKLLLAVGDAAREVHGV